MDESYKETTSPSPSQPEDGSTEREERLRRAILRVADRERRNYRRSFMILIISLTLGLGWLSYSLWKVWNLERSSTSLRQKITENKKDLDDLQLKIAEAQKILEQISKSNSLAAVRQSADEGQKILGGPWVVIGAYPTLENASGQAQRARAQGYDNVSIVYRDGTFRTVIIFTTADVAASKFSDIKAHLETSAYLRDPKIWCPGASQAAGYLKCER